MIDFTYSASFQPPASSPFVEVVNWIEGTLFGTVAITLCVLAIAMIGFSMLSGHLPVRRSLHVVIGCFVVIGAPLIATELIAIIVPDLTTVE